VINGTYEQELNEGKIEEEEDEDYFDNLDGYDSGEITVHHLACRFPPHMPSPLSTSLDTFMFSCPIQLDISPASRAQIRAIIWKEMGTHTPDDMYQLEVLMKGQGESEGR